MQLRKHGKDPGLRIVMIGYLLDVLKRSKLVSSIAVSHKTRNDRKSNVHWTCNQYVKDFVVVWFM